MCCLCLHGLQQLHVSLVPSSALHLVVQLQNDLVLKLQEKEPETERELQKSKEREQREMRAADWKRNQLCKHNYSVSSAFMCTVTGNQ